MKKLAITVLALATVTACQPQDENPGPSGSTQGSGPETIKVTILFEGLMAFLEDDNDGSVWVILPDTRTPDSARDIPAHVPMVFFSGPNSNVRNEIPWLLDLEEIHFDTALPSDVNVDDEVWDGLASLTTLAGGPNAIHPTLTNAAAIPHGAVARLHLKGGKLTVDGRPESSVVGQVDFKTVGNVPHPDNYNTPRASLLLKWEADVDSVTFRTTRFLNGDENYRFVPATSEVRAYVGNLPVLAGHGMSLKDEHFAKLYTLMTQPVSPEYIPHFPDRIVGTRVCMGGKK